MQLTPEQVQSINVLLSAVQVAQRRGAFSLQDAHTLQEALDRFFEFIDSFPNPLLVAQNASFDLRFINVRSGGKLPNHSVLDTMQLMQQYLIPLLKTQSKAKEGDPAARELLNKLYVKKEELYYY